MPRSRHADHCLQANSVSFASTFKGIWVSTWSARANSAERFWFKFDEATKYNAAFINIVVAGRGFDVQEDFAATRSNGTYPSVFMQKFVPRP